MPRRLVPILAAAALWALAALPAANAASSELFFSEYIEGSSNNKALEIFNDTGAAVDLATGGYNVQMFFNGSASAGLTINLVGTVEQGDAGQSGRGGDGERGRGADHPDLDTGFLGEPGGDPEHRVEVAGHRRRDQVDAPHAASAASSAAIRAQSAASSGESR